MKTPVKVRRVFFCIKLFPVQTFLFLFLEPAIFDQYPVINFDMFRSWSYYNLDHRMVFFTVLLSRFSLSLYAHVKLLGATGALRCKFCTFPDSTQVSARCLEGKFFLILWLRESIKLLVLNYNPFECLLIQLLQSENSHSFSLWALFYSRIIKSDSVLNNDYHPSYE